MPCCSSVGQFAAVLVVRTADGEGELREVAFEGTQVLAEDGLEFIETDHRLAAESLHEVLVGIGSRRVVEEVLAQLWGQQHVEERGLEDAALAHEDEYHLVHHLQRYPHHHHRHQPLLEEIAEEALRMLVVGQVLYVDAVGKLLADGETLEVSLSHHSKLRARGNHALEIQPVGVWMALRRFDTRKVRWHRSSLIHAVV